MRIFKFKELGKAEKLEKKELKKEEKLEKKELKNTIKNFKKKYENIKTKEDLLELLDIVLIDNVEREYHIYFDKKKKNDITNILKEEKLTKIEMTTYLDELLDILYQKDVKGYEDPYNKYDANFKYQYEIDYENAKNNPILIDGE